MLNSYGKELYSTEKHLLYKNGAYAVSTYVPSAIYDVHTVAISWYCVCTILFLLHILNLLLVIGKVELWQRLLVIVNTYYTNGKGNTATTSSIDIATPMPKRNTYTY